MRGIAITLTIAALVLPVAGTHAQPLQDRIVAPPPPPGMAPRSGTYADPAARRPQLDFTVQPRRPAKQRKKKRR
jgi:hypothetical protein